MIHTKVKEKSTTSGKCSTDLRHGAEKFPTRRTTRPSQTRKREGRKTHPRVVSAFVDHNKEKDQKDFDLSETSYLAGSSIVVGIFTNEFEKFEWSINSRLELTKLSLWERLLSKMNLDQIPFFELKKLAMLRKLLEECDDILITDELVVQKYRILLDKLGLTVSKAKSIISKTGCIEFAKRFWVKSMQIDLSQVSLRLLLSCRTTISLYFIRNKYPERLKAACCKPNRSHPLPLKWWIGRFGNLNPYLKGKIVDYLWRELKPKVIHFFPEEMVFDKERNILEHIVILNWVKLWLKWCHWWIYGGISGGDFMMAPVDLPSPVKGRRSAYESYTGEAWAPTGSDTPISWMKANIFIGIEGCADQFDFSLYHLEIVYQELGYGFGRECQYISSSSSKGKISINSIILPLFSSKAV
ncbi:hypothetical protein FXO38_06616 [Capsicum annuum]|nr:hypothetical protein FXO38_06616 [Capsicum annuum]